MSYPASKSELKIRNSQEEIMYRSWKDQLQDRIISQSNQF